MNTLACIAGDSCLHDTEPTQTQLGNNNATRHDIGHKKVPRGSSAHSQKGMAQVAHA
jgi:hypothetical protein